MSSKANPSKTKTRSESHHEKVITSTLQPMVQKLSVWLHIRVLVVADRHPLHYVWNRNVHFHNSVNPTLTAPTTRATTMLDYTTTTAAMILHAQAHPTILQNQLLRIQQASQNSSNESSTVAAACFNKVVIDRSIARLFN